MVLGVYGVEADDVFDGLEKAGLDGYGEGFFFVDFEELERSLGLEYLVSHPSLESPEDIVGG